MQHVGTIEDVGKLHEKSLPQIVQTVAGYEARALERMAPSWRRLHRMRSVIGMLAGALAGRLRLPE